MPNSATVGGIRLPAFGTGDTAQAGDT